MKELSPEDERAVDRLTLQLLQDAYFDVAAVLSGAKPQASTAILTAIEQRFTDVLGRIYRDRSEGQASHAIAIAVGERLREIMEQAHGRAARAQMA